MNYYQLNVTGGWFISLNAPTIFNNLKINSGIYDDDNYRYHFMLNTFLKIPFYYIT